jgi:hypothetical protein
MLPAEIDTVGIYDQGAVPQNGPAAPPVEPPPPPAHVLPPPIHLPVGSIVLLRMRGHARSAGLDYFAPAVVLEQHPVRDTNEGGELEVLIWDSSAGTHYNPCYPVRELETRGEGGERWLVEKQSNIDRVLFDPDNIERMQHVLHNLQVEVVEINHKLLEISSLVANLAGTFDQRLKALESAPSAEAKKAK